MAIVDFETASKRLSGFIRQKTSVVIHPSTIQIWLRIISASETPLPQDRFDGFSKKMAAKLKRFEADIRTLANQGRGAVAINSELKRRYPKLSVPSATTIRRFLNG
ncbi:MAG: hypothetical protein ABWK02_06150 [Aquificaceae bacterium]